MITRAASTLLWASLLLSACATQRPPLTNGENEPQEASAEVVQLPEQVAAALILGGARAQAGDLEGALSYYRFAHELLPDDAHIALRYADTALQKGQPREALQALDRAARLHAGDPDIESRRIRIHLALGDLPAATELASSAAKANPRSAELLELYAITLENGAEPGLAIGVYDRLLALRPGDRTLLRSRAELLLAAGRGKEARAQVETALRADADDHEMLELHKQILEAQQKTADALPFLRELVELHPKAVPPRTQLADRLLGLGDAEGAVAALLPVAGGGELSWGPRMLLADLLLRLNRLEESQALVDDLLREGHEAALLFRLAGELAQQSEDLPTAERWLRRAVKADENDLEAHVALLLVQSQQHPELFERRDPPTEEINAFNRLLTRADGLARGPNLRYDYLIGTLMRRTGRYGEAVTRLERALENDPESEDVLYDLAICQEELGRYQDARLSLERLVELRPRDAHYLNFFGYLLAEQGWELERAESLILEALDAEPENPFYLDSLGWVYYKSGRFELAYETLNQAMEGLREDPTILEHVGDALRALGQNVEALGMYRRALERGGERERLESLVLELEKSIVENP